MFLLLKISHTVVHFSFRRDIENWHFALITENVSLIEPTTRRMMFVHVY